MGTADGFKLLSSHPKHYHQTVVGICQCQQFQDSTPLLTESFMGKEESSYDSKSYDGCKVGYQKRSILSKLDHSINQAMHFCLIGTAVDNIATGLIL